MERDLNDFYLNYNFEKDEFSQNVKKIMSLNFFNRIKQFMMRLFRYNLFLVDKASNEQKNYYPKMFCLRKSPSKSCGSNVELCQDK